MEYLQAVIGMMTGWPPVLQFIFSGGILLVVYSNRVWIRTNLKKLKKDNGNGKEIAAVSTRLAVEGLRDELAPLLSDIRAELKLTREGIIDEFSRTRELLRDVGKESSDQTTMIMKAIHETQLLIAKG